MLSPCRHHGPVRRGALTSLFWTWQTPRGSGAIRRPGLNYASSVGQVILSQSKLHDCYRQETEPPPPPPQVPVPLPPRSPSPFPPQVPVPPPPPPRPSAGCFIIKPLPRPPADAAGWSPGDSTFGSRGGSVRAEGTPRPDGGTWTGHTDATDGSAQFRRCRPYWLINLN